MIITIVEGDGDVYAMPILIRRIAHAAALDADVPRPIRVKRDRFLNKANELERYVELTARQSGSSGRILIVLDAEDDCPRDLTTEILRRATATQSDRHIQVVLAKREYEAWFLAAANSLADHRELRTDMAAPDVPESVRDAKGWLTSHMPRGRAYKETRDQPPLTDRFDLHRAPRVAPLFDKM